MPLRGESVGTAYVRIVADGTGFPQSVRDEFDKASHSFNDAGNVGAKQFKQGVDEEMANWDDKDLDKAFNKALINDKTAEEIFNGEGWKKLTHNLEAQWGAEGTKASEQMRNKFLASGNVQGLLRDVEAVVGRINTNAVIAGRAERKAADDAKKSMDDFERDFRRVMQETSDLSRSVSRNNISNLEGLRRTLENMHNPVTTVAKALFDMKRNAKDTSDEADRDSSVFTKMANTMDDLGSKIGIGFGKGNRNNLINFFGSFVQGIFSVISVFPRMLGNITEFGQAFSDARVAGEGFFKALSTGFTGAATDAGEAEAAIGSLSATGPAGIIALAVAVGILGAALLPVVSLISGLAAAIVALVSSVAFAIVGTLAPLAGLIVPLAVALGTVIAAVKTLDKQQKKSFINDLSAGLKELGKTARDNFLVGLTASHKDFMAVIRTLNPLLAATARELGKITTLIVHGFQSAGFDHFVAVMTRFVPHALDQLGKVLANVGVALGNIFIDLIPSTNSFLGWLVKITGEFAKWTGSKTGRREILDFLNKASDSAKAVWGFLGQVTQLLATLLAPGKKTGDDIFTSLGKQVGKFNQYLKDHPKALGDWFKNGKQVADDLGNISVALIHIIDALDSPAGRRALHFILQFTDLLITLIGSGISVGLKPVELGLNNLVTILTALGDAAKWAWKHLRELPGAITKLFSGGFSGAGKSFIDPKSFTDWIPTVLRVYGNFMGRALSALGITRMIRVVGEGVGQVGRIFGRLPGLVSAAWSSIGRATSVAWNRITSAVSTAVRNVVNFILSIPGRINSVVGSLSRIAGQMGAAILGGFAGIARQIVGQFAGLGSAIAAAIGAINLTVHFNIPLLHHPKTTLNDPGLPNLGPPGTRTTPGTSGLTTGPSKTYNNVFNITTPTADPRAVALEAIAHLAASGY